MRAILHYLFVLLGLIVLFVRAGLPTTTWVTVALIVNIIYQNIKLRDLFLDRTPMPSMRLAVLVDISRMIVPFGTSVLLFILVGWTGTLGFWILFIGYFVIRPKPEKSA